MTKKISTTGVQECETNVNNLQHQLNSLKERWLRAHLSFHFPLHHITTNDGSSMVNLEQFNNTVLLVERPGTVSWSTTDLTLYGKLISSFKWRFNEKTMKLEFEIEDVEERSAIVVGAASAPAPQKADDDKGKITAKEKTNAIFTTIFFGFVASVYASTREDPLVMTVTVSFFTAMVLLICCAPTKKG